jgi:hypothetical protein
VELQPHIAEFESESIKLSAISYDAVEILSGFASDHGITFPILADVDSRIIREFGILNTLIRLEEVVFMEFRIPERISSNGTSASPESSSIANIRCAKPVRPYSAQVSIFRSILRRRCEMMPEPKASGFQCDGASSSAARRPVRHSRYRARITCLQTGCPKGYVPTTALISAPEGVIVGDPIFPDTILFRIDGLAEEFQVFDHDTKITVPVESRIREVGPAAPDIEVQYQACNDRECFTPRTERLRIEFETGSIVPGRRQE